MISFLIWLFNFIPNFLVYGFLILSIIAFFFSKFLPVDIVTKNYIKTISIGIFILSLYASGMIAVINDYKEQVREFELQLAIAEEKSNAINTEIKYIYLDKKVKTQEKSKKIQESIDKQSESINKSCVLNKSMIELHNRAIEHEK